MGYANGRRRQAAGISLLMLVWIACNGTPADTVAPPSRSASLTTATTELGAKGELAVVVHVTDGDTIRVRFPEGTEEPVRLIGIDAPEQGGDLATAAAGYLSELVSDREVRLLTDVSDRDRFGRLLRYVYVGDVFVNEAMVLAGLAVAKRYEPDTSMTSILEQAEQAARDLGVGMWSPTAAPTATMTTLALATANLTADCHPSYEDACVPVGVEDVDCLGGSGNGPYYVGTVRVVGPDEYGLDRDTDGIGCEN